MIELSRVLNFSPWCHYEWPILTANHQFLLSSTTLPHPSLFWLWMPKKVFCGSGPTPTMLHFNFWAKPLVFKVFSTHGFWLWIRTSTLSSSSKQRINSFRSWVIKERCASVFWRWSSLRFIGNKPVLKWHVLHPLCVYVLWILTNCEFSNAY